MKNYTKFRLPTILLFASMLFFISCEEDEVPLTQIDHLSKTWAFQSLESSTMDPAVIVEFNELLTGMEVTFIEDAQKLGSGTYTSIFPNDPDDPTGQGTWQSGPTSDNVETITLDGESNFHQRLTVITLNATQLHVSIYDGGTYEIKYAAK